MKRRQSGFTIMELLKTVGILSIVLSFGVPSMTSLMQRNQIVTYTNDFIATVNTARSQALNNVAQVTVCKSRDQNTCDNGASWMDGWIVFVDNNENEIRDLGGVAETVISTREALEGSYTLDSAAFANWIAFRPNGLAIGSNGNAGRFTLCNTKGQNPGRDIDISRTGSPAVIENAPGECP